MSSLLERGLSATLVQVDLAVDRYPEVKRAHSQLDDILAGLEADVGTEKFVLIEDAINAVKAANILAGFKVGVSEGRLLSENAGKPKWLESMVEQELIPEPDAFNWKPNIKDVINRHTGFLDTRMHDISLSLRELESVDHDDDRVKDSSVYRLLKKELDMLSMNVAFIERLREALDD